MGLTLLLDILVPLSIGVYIVLLLVRGSKRALI
jgi:hypothetical protein